ncbi:lytic polysaccharide monooxygenase [Streptomyces sp. TG1A-60]|uniref:lytic polysaccharide monooxygenase n=1 Tax=Streptomyces sp. TG1A-60 TaxID=3129111 RepID=UPI0030CE5128
MDRPSLDSGARIRDPKPRAPALSRRHPSRGAGLRPHEAAERSDLPERPFASVTDPQLRDGSYRFPAKPPTDRPGHHVLCAIRHDTSTVDTCYSCSDAAFPWVKQADSKTDGARPAKPPAGGEETEAEKVGGGKARARRQAHAHAHAHGVHGGAARRSGHGRRRRSGSRPRQPRRPPRRTRAAPPCHWWRAVPAALVLAAGTALFPRGRGHHSHISCPSGD